MSDAVFPAPSVQPEAAIFWQKAQQRALWLPRCRTCMRLHFYPRAVCPYCHSAALEWEAMSGSGTIYSFTVATRAPHPRLEAATPFVPALIDLVEEVRIPTRVLCDDPDALRIGASVMVTFEAARNHQLVPVFRPA